MSVNAHEIEKFRLLANDWWDINGSAQPLHHINAARIEYIFRHIESENINIMDLGCGAGILTESLYRQFPNIIGVDACTDMINVAKQHSENSGLNINYSCNSIENLCDEYNESFDVIVCMELLEHVENPEKFLSYCRQCLKHNGILIISTVNRNFKSYAGAIIAAEHIFKLLPTGTHDYSKFIKPSELNKILYINDFELIDITGLEYLPITKSASLSKNIDINYLACAIKR
ncbi:MAG: bifunctional 2-polyprenyl-6-hydroxyphenol methylase/3-demethylubiquinol 3-O-methyltransferase UbiG [Francisellaceae bacterium]|jgi:2-polyprenyl-6-hydroxyphenyl methylase / 3-demethylubiquinone-9 3-methyltransferase|nr:bifunctional 2-polyprenyl-6-hydroxyphenol methylase/3-demethylubiquinol 3-O-methyltransferase UbiG [Francisellaceae bacterium]MBT6208156.1 bifunctional 2-polyprenyl-6-hydroxyphenol methylase/3-demethylubiquinol 3-O-methyltransferase UbiG [Francisellaceae bacterium]MBT6539472.1 bifunctional 2-polyprenyl-6-hydroxyphenol methylase/3-demethylubiquinol 3-O-methyltransferase UbiG [Francisellaceae bacterium]